MATLMQTIGGMMPKNWAFEPGLARPSHDGIRNHAGPRQQP